MASPRNPNRTVRTTTTSTIACPLCRLPSRPTSVLRLVGGGRADHDVIGGQLLDERGERDEVVADRDLERRVIVGGVRRAAAAAGGRPVLAAGRVLQAG